MKPYVGYFRVFTARQGERGVSLQEKRDAIQGYAERHQLEISGLFEERETAARRGRPISNETVKLLYSFERSRRRDSNILHGCPERQFLLPPAGTPIPVVWNTWTWMKTTYKSSFAFGKRNLTRPFRQPTRAIAPQAFWSFSPFSRNRCRRNVTRRVMAMI